MVTNVSEIGDLYSPVPTPLNISMAFLYAIIVIAGITGNSLIIAIVWREKSMHSPTNLLLVNVAAADVLSLLLCPIPYAVSLSSSHPTGLLGEFVCKFFTGHATTSVTVSVTYMTLVLLAVERYHGIVKPFKRELRLTKVNVAFAILLIWIFSIGISTFAFLRSSYDEQYGRCLDAWTIEKAHSSRTLFAGLLAIPGISSCFLFYCYFRVIRTVYFDTQSSRILNKRDLLSKRRIVRILLTVTFAFYLCYTPFLVFEVVISYMDPKDLMNDYKKFYVVYRVVVVIIYLNSALNPFLYGFQSSTFRANFKNVICCRRKTRNIRKSAPGTKKRTSREAAAI